VARSRIRPLSSTNVGGQTRVLSFRRRATQFPRLGTPAPSGRASAQRFAGGSVRLQPRDRAIILESASAAGFPALGGRSFSSDINPRNFSGASASDEATMQGEAAGSLGGRSFRTCVATRRVAASPLAILTPAPGGRANVQQFAGGRVRLQPRDRAIVWKSASAAGFPALGGRSFSSDINPRNFSGALAPDEATMQGEAA
jgi:hypothetical protein